MSRNECTVHSVPFVQLSALPSQPELATGDLTFSSTLPLSPVLVASLPISPSKLEAHTSTGPILPLSWRTMCGYFLSSCQTLRLWVLFMRSDRRSRHSTRRSDLGLLSITIGSSVLRWFPRNDLLPYPTEIGTSAGMGDHAGAQTSRPSVFGTSRVARGATVCWGFTSPWVTHHITTLLRSQGLLFNIWTV